MKTGDITHSIGVLVQNREGFALKKDAFSSPKCLKLHAYTILF